jgi:hypothetical protein
LHRILAIAQGFQPQEEARRMLLGADEAEMPGDRAIALVAIRVVGDPQETQLFADFKLVENFDRQQKAEADTRGTR